LLVDCQAGFGGWVEIKPVLRDCLSTTSPVNLCVEKMAIQSVILVVTHGHPKEKI
jgi:hypothetical protein